MPSILQANIQTPYAVARNLRFFSPSFRGYGVAGAVGLVATLCRGGFARRSSSSTTSEPRSSFACLLCSMVSRTHSLIILLFVSSIDFHSFKDGDNGSNHGCSSRALNVGRFRGLLLRLRSAYVQSRKVKQGCIGIHTTASQIPAQPPRIQLEVRAARHPQSHSTVQTQNYTFPAGTDKLPLQFPGSIVPKTKYPIEQST